MDNNAKPVYTVPAERKCPHCDADLAYEVNGRAYSLAVGVEVPGLYDGVAFWTHQINDCGMAWHRWIPGHSINVKADFYVAQWNEQALEDRKAK
jgi:hypothetical protein